MTTTIIIIVLVVILGVLFLVRRNARLKKQAQKDL
jgi:hypothetical protein